MLVLALDTSTSQGGVALVEARQKNLQNSALALSQSIGSDKSEVQLIVRSRAVWQRVKSHSEFLTPTIQTVLDETGATLKDVDAFAVGRGPGSFTGIRIAMSAVKGLAYALQKPVYAFDTLEILANSVTDHSRPVLSLVNAHKNLLFTNIYDWRATGVTACRSLLSQDPAKFADDSDIVIPSADATRNLPSRSPLGQWVPRLKIQALSIEDVARLVQEPILCVGDGYLEYQEHFPIELKLSLKRNALFADEPSPDTLGKMALTPEIRHQALEWNSLQALYIRASGAEESLVTNQR